MQDFRTAFAICALSFRTVVANWGAVLRLIALPVLLPICVSLVIVLAVIVDRPGGVTQSIAADRIVSLLLLLIVVVGAIAVAVAWHRVTLTGEAPTYLHMFRQFSLTIRYLGRTIQIGLITGIVLVVLTLAVRLVADAENGTVRFDVGRLPTPLTALNLALSLVFMPLATAVTLLFSLVLPASAIRQPIGLKDSLAAAEKLPFATFFHIGLILHLASIVIGAVLAELAGGGIGRIILSPFIVLFWTIYGVALLSTLYAILVQGKPLAREHVPDTPPG